MTPVRVHVISLGNGYLAESQEPLLTAAGTSAEEAAENARVMALDFAALAGQRYANTLIVRIDEPGRCVIAMQSLEQPFSLEAAGKAYGSCYFDSAGNEAAPASH
jgi:hypothetical protein